MSGKCFETVRSKKCSSVVLCVDFVSTIYVGASDRHTRNLWVVCAIPC